MSKSSIRIAPSVLSADFGHLADQVKLADEGGADLIHLDIMDGHFVPNITVGPMIVSTIRGLTEVPLDVHLMIEKPESYIQDFIDAGAGTICVHLEACNHLHRTLAMIRDQGVVTGIALNPATPIIGLVNVLDDVDFVTVMSVNPGFGGQQFIPQSLEKIHVLRKSILDRKAQVDIEVDGGITTSNVLDVVKAGANIIVAGSFVFDSPDIPDAVRKLRAVAAME